MVERSLESWDRFVQSAVSAGASSATRSGRQVVGRYVDLEREHRALRSGAGLVDRSYRGLLEITGKDRATWLHNLTTNQVKNLGRNEGVHAFALNVQGRILFDLNILVREDCVWVDLDRGFLATARKHFDKYIIMEDVRVADRSDEYVRLGLAGDASRAVMAGLGAPQAATMPSLGLSQVPWQGVEIPFIRHDYCGSFGVELFVPAPSAAECWRALTDSGGAIPAGDEAVQVCRIESGIPGSGREITDEALPAETGQMERAVSVQKGCYLGQEVVERMRARKVVARLLCGLSIEGDVPTAGAEIRGLDDQRLGNVTSSCRSVALGRTIGMGYVKSARAAIGAEVRIVQDDSSCLAKIAALPFVGSAAH